MKGVTILSVYSLALLFLFSCQKEVRTPLDNPVSLPKTFTENVTSSVLGHSVTTYDLTYDNNNRILSVTDSANTGNKQIYQYGNSNFTMDLYSGNRLSIHEIFYISALSLVDSTLQYNDTKDSSTEKYTYNSLKQLVKLNEYDYSANTGGVLNNTHTYTYDNNGNQLTDSDTSSITTYTYYPNLTNTLLPGQLYFYQPQNLVQTTTIQSGGETVTLNHTYTFDNNNRQTSEKIVASNGDIIIRSYTY